MGCLRGGISGAVGISVWCACVDIRGNGSICFMCSIRSLYALSLKHFKTYACLVILYDVPALAGSRVLERKRHDPLFMLL